MERIPKTLVLHKRTDGFDTRLASLQSPFVQSPLANRLEVTETGRYRRATGTDGEQWAFEKVADLWDDDPDSDSGDDDDEAMVAVQTGLAEDIAESNIAPAPAEDEVNAAAAGATAAGQQEPIEEEEPIRRNRRGRKRRGARGKQEENPYKRHYPQPARGTAAHRASERQRIRGESTTALRDLHTKILCSTDTLFLVRYRAAGEDIHGWNLVKFDIDNSDQERVLKLGEY